MSSSKTKIFELIAVQVSEQDYAGMLVPKKCDEQEKTDEKQREADNGIGQPAEKDHGKWHPAEGDDVTGQPAEEKKPSIPYIQALLMALKRPLIHIEEYNWPEEDEEFDGRNVVIIGINGSREAEDAFDCKSSALL